MRELRAYACIDRMQPQFAAYAAATIQGDVPVAGIAELFTEVAPTNEALAVADVALKAAQARPATRIEKACIAAWSRTHRLSEFGGCPG